MLLTELISQFKKLTVDKSREKPILDVITKLEECAVLNEIKTSDLEEPRKLLNQLTNKTPTKANEILNNLVFNTLLALAQLAPLNDEDPINLEEINANDAVFISTGYQFSLTNLINWHKHRPLRDDEEEKVLLDPTTNIAFAKKDMEHIWTIAKQRKIVLDDKASVPTPLNIEQRIRNLATPHNFFTPKPFESTTDFFITCVAPITIPITFGLIALLATATVLVVTPVSIGSLLASRGAGLLQKPDAQESAFNVATKTAEVTSYASLLALSALAIGIIAPLPAQINMVYRSAITLHHTIAPPSI